MQVSSRIRLLCRDCVTEIYQTIRSCLFGRYSYSNGAGTGDIQGPRLPALQAGEVSTVTEVEFTTSVEVEVTVSADSAAGASRMEELASSTLKDSDSLAQISQRPLPFAFFSAVLSPGSVVYR